MKMRAALLLIVAAVLVGWSVLPAQADLVGYWRFDGNAQDASGNSNHGTAGSSIKFVDDTPLGSGKSGENYGNGSANVITVGTSPTLESIDTELTLAFWMKATITDAEDWDRLFQHGTESSSSPPSWMVNQNSSSLKTNVRVDTTGTGGKWNQNIATGGADTYGDGTVPATWHHLVYVLKDNDTTAKYVDGSEITGTYKLGDGLSNTRDLYIFGRNGAGDYQGKLDDIGLWSHALSKAYARSTYTLPAVLGLDYDLGDVMALWDTYEDGVAGAATNINIDGIGWTFTASLPGSTDLGDAYKFAGDGKLYVVLGNGNGLVGVPEPSTVAMLLGLAGMGLFGYLRRRRRS